MSIRRGAPSRLSRTTVRCILRWHEQRQQVWAELGTVEQLAGNLGFSIPVVRRALRQLELGVTPQFTAMHTRGRPSQWTPESFAILRRWWLSRRRSRATQPSAEALAQHLGVSRRIVFYVIQRSVADSMPDHTRRGLNSPDRQHSQSPSRQRQATMKRNQTRLRAELLRSWPTPPNGWIGSIPHSTLCAPSAGGHLGKRPALRDQPRLNSPMRTAQGQPATPRSTVNTRAQRARRR